MCPPAGWRSAALALVCLAAGACASLRTAFPPAQVSTAQARPVLLADVPFHPQTDHHCGPAALAGVLGASGVPLAPEALAPQVYLPARQGSLQVELLAAARRAGRIPHPVEPTLEALVAELEAGRPVLVLQNLLVRSVPRWHYVVLVGADPRANRVILNSGTQRALPVRASRFLRTWDWAGRWGFVALRPGELPARADAGTYLRAVADFEAVAGPAQAQPAYAAALRRWPADPRVHLALGNQAYQAGRRAQAAAHYRTGLRHAPGDAVLANNLASVLGELGCVREARAVLDGVAADGTGPWRERLAQTRRELDAASRTPAVCRKGEKEEKEEKEEKGSE